MSSSSGVRVVALADTASSSVAYRECDLPIADASVSRRYTMLRARQGNVAFIEDLHRGSWQHERHHHRRPRLDPGERVLLRIGATFELGSVTCVLHRAPVPALLAALCPLSRHACEGSLRCIRLHAGDHAVADSLAEVGGHTQRRLRTREHGFPARTSMDSRVHSVTIRSTPRQQDGWGRPHHIIGHCAISSIGVMHFVNCASQLVKHPGSGEG